MRSRVSASAKRILRCRVSILLVSHMFGRVALAGMRMNQANGDTLAT
jgi:hypothetical protein